MKRNKLFIIPLVSACFLLNCVNGENNFDKFKREIEKNYNLDTIKEKYVGKNITFKGTYNKDDFNFTSKITSIDNISEYDDFPSFNLDKFPQEYFVLPFNILSPKLLDYFLKMSKDQQKAEFNYLKDKNNYIVRANSTTGEADAYFKVTFNNELVLIKTEYSAYDKKGDGFEYNLDITYTI